MSKITVLPTIERKASDATIEILEELLQDAKDGLVTEVAILAFSPTGSDRFVSSPLMDTIKKLGSLEQIKHDILITRPNVSKD